MSTDSENTDFGTGFIVSTNGSTSYIITCAHVVRDIGGKTQINVDGKRGELLAQGEVNGFDLSLIAVNDLFDKNALKISQVATEGDAVVILGFSRDKYTILKRVYGEIHQESYIGVLGQQQLSLAWNFTIHANSPAIERGYSGAPVIREADGYVIGVAIAKQDDMGLILSLNDVLLLKNFILRDVDLQLKENMLTIHENESVHENNTESESNVNTSINNIIYNSEYQREPILLQNTGNVLENIKVDDDTIFFSEIRSFLNVEIIPIVKEKENILITSLSDYIVNYITKTVLISSIINYREGKIVTLRKLESHIIEQVHSWLSGEEAKNEFQNKYIEWLAPIIFSILPSIFEIGKEFNLEADKPIFGLDPSIGDTKITIDDFIRINYHLKDILSVLTMLGSGSIATLATLLITAMAAQVGGIIAAVVAFFAVFYGSSWLINKVVDIVNNGLDKSEDYLKDSEIPLWLRRYLFSDKRIENFSNSEYQRLDSTIKKLINNLFTDNNFSNEAIGSINQYIKYLYSSK